ncbi:MAG: glycosyltransferase [Acetobacteraceae bacterium]|nr:glycosyltransferase [Acetobacteraceae bacterium]
MRPRPLGSLPGCATVVAIPAKNEAEHIGACLRALAMQQDAQADAVVLVVNNTRDGSAGLARSLAPALPFALHVVEHDFPTADACAGQARRMAMECAAALAGQGGALLTTDADGQVAPDWLARNLAYLDDGIEVVAGCAVLDPADALLIPPRLHEDDARECAYAAVLDEIAALLDPDPWDPLPRHTEHSGASTCVTLSCYRRAGGMPAAPLAEDRAFFAALRRVDARIRHAPDVQVVVSGRTEGRAPGGMADTIRRRLTCADAWLDDALEPAVNAIRRARLRKRVRRICAPGVPEATAMRGLAHDLGAPVEIVAAALRSSCFGDAWATLEAESPALARVKVAVADLPREMARASHALRRLRELDMVRVQGSGYPLLPSLAAAAPAWSG